MDECYEYMNSMMWMGFCGDLGWSRVGVAELAFYYRGGSGGVKLREV